MEPYVNGDMRHSTTLDMTIFGQNPPCRLRHPALLGSVFRGYLAENKLTRFRETLVRLKIVRPKIQETW